MIYKDPRDQVVDDAAIKALTDAYGERVTGLPPVAIVIAAYNEAGAIGPVIEALPAEVCGLATATIVVADGCADSTVAEAAEAGAMVADVPVNRGQGAALRLGYRIAREGGAAYIITTDADGQYNPAEMATVLGPVVAGEADFVTGSRQLGSQETKDMIRRAGVRFFASTISLLTGQRISDTTFGLRAMRSEVTGAVQLAQPQYQASELLIGVITHGYKVAEVPATIHRRRVGESKKGQNPLYKLHIPGVNNFFYGLRFARVAYGTYWRERQRSRSSSSVTLVWAIGLGGPGERLGAGVGRCERLFGGTRRVRDDGRGEEDVVEEQEAQQERADVGHAVHGVDVEHALDPGQVHPARRVVRELGGQQEDHHDHRGDDPERQGLLEQARAALPLPRPAAEHVAHQRSGEPADDARPGGGQVQRPGADRQHHLGGGERRDGRDGEAAEADAELAARLLGQRVAEPVGYQSH